MKMTYQHYEFKVDDYYHYGGKCGQKVRYFFTILMKDRYTPNIESKEWFSTEEDAIKAACNYIDEMENDE